MTQQPDPYNVNAGTPNPPPGNMPPPPGSMPLPGAPLNYGTPPSGAPTYAGPPPTKDDQNLAMLAHLLGILGFIGPLIVWLIKKDSSPFVDDQGKEALNFHLTMLIGYVVGGITSFFCIGFIVILAVAVISIIFSIMGAMKANQGIPYRYPLTIRMIK